jgi:hypothetical protein
MASVSAVVHEARRRRLRFLLLCLLMPPHTEPEFGMLHRAFDSWSGLGQITACMTRQGWDLELKHHSTLGGGHQGERWYARYVSGMGCVIEGGTATGRRRARRCSGAAWAALADGQA